MIFGSKIYFTTYQMSDRSHNQPNLKAINWEHVKEHIKNLGFPCQGKVLYI